MLQIVLGQDGEVIDDKIKKFNLTDDDKRYSKKKQNYLLDFVGFIIENEKLLAVFPKHFFDGVDKEAQTKKQTEENLKLLFNVIRKYNKEVSSIAIADKYIGYEENFQSDYPFEAFFKIYDYYKKYGIYKEEEKILSKDTRGRISWKDTIQKSNVIASNGNLIFLPIYSKRKNTKNAFLSECMIFAINHTIRNFRCFIDLPPVQAKECKIDFLANREYTLRMLYQYRNTIFKDYQKQLVNNLIEFFEQLSKKGGPIHFKIRYFEAIWERLVGQYLNDSFVGVDTENYKLIFDDNTQINRFESKSFDIDKSDHEFVIRPDHYYCYDNTICVFDSKYYDEISDMNYKQFAYTILLGNSQFGNGKNLYSALILPGKTRSGLHLKLDSPYCQLNPGCNFIIEQFLDVRVLMRNYLGSSAG